LFFFHCDYHGCVGVWCSPLCCFMLHMEERQGHKESWALQFS
jgi:hypothetical protein